LTSLHHLYAQGETFYDSALTSRDSANDLRLMIKLARYAPQDTASSVAGLFLESNEDDLSRR